MSVRCPVCKCWDCYLLTAYVQKRKPSGEYGVPGKLTTVKIGLYCPVCHHFEAVF